MRYASTPPTEPLTAQAVRAEHVETLYRLMPRALPVYPFGGTLLVATLWNEQPHGELLLWLGVLMLITTVRAVSIFQFNRRPRAARDAVAWSRSGALSAFFSGLMLGVSALAFLNAAEPMSVLVIAAIIMGATSGANASLYPYPPAYWAFVAPSMGTLIVVLLAQDEPATFVVAVVCVLIQVTNLLTSQALFRAMDTALRVSHENEALLHRAEQASAAKTRFLAAASHDLRQPLHALGLFVAMLTDELKTPRSRSLFQQIEGALASVGTMLTSILDISKLDAGIVKPVSDTVDLGAMFRRLEQEFTPAAVERGNRLRVRPTGLYLHSDSKLLERILRNLIANAVRYTHDGRILVAARQRGAEVRCEVHDTGRGIAPDQQRAIFEEFYQVDNAERDRGQGMGLGLAIVERNAGLLGHPLALVSEPDKGSCFSILVPIEQSSELQVADPERMEAADFDGMSVLLVDDDRVILTAMSALLERWGCKVLAADSPQSAVAQLEGSGQAPHMLMVDYRLRAGVTGGEVIALVQARFTQPIPAIIVTGDTAPERLREANEAGHPLLHKPVEPERLKETMRQLLSAQL